MAILSLENFQNKLNINEYDLILDENIAQSRTAGGHVLSSSFGPRLWTGFITTTQNRHSTSLEQNALIQSIQNPNTYFLFSPPKGQFPKYDPTGSRMGSAIPKISATIAGYTMGITALPANYIITAGDYVSYTDSLGINRLHQFVETKTATSAGLISSIRLLNPLLAGNLPAAGTTLTFIRPSVTVQYVQGTLKKGSVLYDRGQGSSFEFVQAIRAS